MSLPVAASRRSSPPPRSAVPRPQETAWPSRPLRAIVAFPAGSGTDSLARFYADRLGRVLGQPVTVDNMGGANGAIATRAAARAAPDGYTLFFGTVSTYAANPNLLREPGYDLIAASPCLAHLV